jgi:hypothetical protein
VVIGVEAVGCKVRTGTVVVDMSEAAAVDPGGGLDMLLSFLEDVSWRIVQVECSLTEFKIVIVTVFWPRFGQVVCIHNCILQVCSTSNCLS